jgi:hypothetical protein
MNELELVRQLLEEPAPGDDVVAAGRERLAGLAGDAGLARGAGVRRRWRLRVLAAGTGLAAVVTALVVLVVFQGTAPPAGGGEALQARLLAAYDASSGDVLYETETFGAGEAEQWWYSPWQPAAGQHVRLRTLQTVGGTPVYATAAEYVMPRNIVPDSMVVVSAPGSTFVNYRARTWGKRTIMVEVGVPAQPGWTREGILEGKWRLAGRTEIGGQPAEELAGALPSTRDVRVWVNSLTYLPVRMQWTAAGHQRTAAFEFLPPAPASQALLKLPVPAGFTQLPSP